jgi:hypothetical protein
MKQRAVAWIENVSHQSKGEGTPNGVSRLEIRRVFHGDLDGEGSADLHAYQPSPNEFSYVGTDTFSGSLGGRIGAFVFQHGGIHSENGLRTFGFIAPLSGSGALEGISGEVAIEVDSNGKHKLILDYAL